MSEGFWAVAVIVAGVVVYIAAKIVFYARKSEQQWREVDKSKLRKWDDEEDS